MTHLNPKAPLRSLRDLRPGLSLRLLGAARTPPISDAAVADAERIGPGIRVSTLAEYARALGYRLVLGVEPLEEGER